MVEVSKLKKGRDKKGKKEERGEGGGQTGLRVAETMEVTFLRSLESQIMVSEVG